MSDSSSSEVQWLVKKSAKEMEVLTVATPAPALLLKGARHTVCQLLVDEFDRKMCDLRHDMPYEWTNYSTECKHYRTTLELAASSERGCHLCRILWARLQAETSSLKSPRLLESHLQATSTRTLDIGLHSYALRVFRESP